MSPNTWRRPYGERTSTVGCGASRVGARDPAVGQQHDAVVHRHAQVLLADDVLGLRRAAGWRARASSALARLIVGGAARSRD